MVTENGQSDGNTSFLRAARNGQLEKVLEYLKTNIDINTSNANGLNALHLASKDGHVEIVEELLKRGAIVDAATKKGNTALHIASLAGQEEVVKLLVQHGASVNVQSQNGFTPLYMAAQENHDNVVKFLLANGANQSLSTEDGFTPLAVAMQQGHDKVVTVLLENDTRGKVRLPALHIAAKKDDVRAAKLLLENDHNPDVTSKSGFTPLHIASHYGNQSIANLLIQKGADVNYSAKHNITPLHVAAKWGKSNMVSLLLEQGAHIEAKTRDGLTPLHCAARSGHEQVVDMLLEKSAPISSKTKNGLAPLHMAAQGDHVDAARILLYHRAPVDEVTVDYLTALHVAAHCGHVRVAKLLLDRQADANARALNGFTPLHIACKKNRIKVVELLLKHGACIGATTESGLTPLHVASFMGCMNIVIYLLQHDASPDIPTVRGETPLHLAARANQTDIIRILLRNGAQVDARAREQQTPLHVASRLGNVDIVMLLLQHGAKIDNTTKDMYTSLHIAAKEGQDEVAAVLIENGASLNSTTKKGFTPLHLAAKYGHLKVAKLLVQKEAPVDAQGKNGVTPLHVASHFDHQNVALLLLDKGASPHANAKNGHTPLHIAARKNQMDIANTLLEYGAKPDVESKAGFTPLHLSAQKGHVEISSLLLEHKATPDYRSKNDLTPMHLCAQENKVAVAELLQMNGAEIDTQTKGGYTPLHIACHYGQADMVKFLLSKGADVKATTSLGYTPLHQAAQQGHNNIVNLLLENSAQPNAITNNGQTPLHIAQKLGYITVIDTLKEVTDSVQSPVLSEEKYRVVAPELMHETFLSDSEEEGEDTLLGDQTYRYLTADEMKSLGDDSLPIDVTRDERVDSNRMEGNDDPNAYPPRHIEDSISPEHIHPNYIEYIKKATDNVDISRHPMNIGKLHWKNFLVSFLVDARGGAMRGCRHSGVRVIVPPRCAPSPTRITCRYVRPQRTPHPPPLMEGEALASRVLELGPVGAKFLGPVIIEVPHFAALRGKEREIVILRSDNGESWKEHTIEATEDVLNEVLRESFDTEDLNQLEDTSSGRTTRIITQDFPQYFAVISRIRQEVHAIGPEGGMVSSTVVPQVQAVFPQGALTKKIKVGLQAQPIDPELTAKLLGHGVAVSPVVTVEPRRRKFHKAITLSMPAPRAHSQGMINQYSGSTPTLRLLCSITGGTSRAQWEDVTGSTPLTFVNDCVSFTTTVSARFWLMDCRNIGDATKMATELYREAIHVPFIAKFMVFAKRIDPLEARLRVFCMTDDKEEKTLEYQEQFTEIAKSRDVEVMEGKSQYIEFAGNLVPITKSGEQLQFSFRAFKENRLPFSVRVKDQHAEAVSRCLFMREPKVQKGEPPQQPICILNIVLPDDIVSETISLTDSDSIRRKYYANENFDYYRQDPRLADISNLLGDDWVELANQLGLTSSEINVIKSEYPDSVAKQAQSMLRMWLSQSGNRVQTNTLENALRRIGRDDIANQCLNVDNRNQEILRIRAEEKEKHRLITDNRIEDIPNQEKYIKEEIVMRRVPDNVDKYSAEEKTFEPSDEEEDFNKTVPERREQIVKRLSTERTIPGSSQRVEIVQEISSIKRQSLVEDKIAEVQQKANIEPMKITTIKPVSKIIQEKMSISEKADMEVTTEETTEKTQIDVQRTEKREDVSINNLDNLEKPDRRDSVLLEEVTQLLETKKPVTKLIDQEDPNSPRFSKTPPPSPADFIMKEKQATTIQEWNATEDSEKKPRSQPVSVGDDISGNTTSTQYLIKLEEKLPDKTLDPPIVAYPNFELNNFTSYCNETNAFLQFETEIEKSDIQTSVFNPVKSLNFESSISNEPNVIFSNSELAYNIPQVVNIPNLGENKLFAIQVTKKLEEVSHTSDFEHSKSSPLSEDKKFSHTWIDAECKFSEGKEATKIFNETSLKGALLSTDSKEETMIIEKQDCETSKESLQDTEKYKTKEDGPPRVDDDQVIKYKVVTHDESKLMEVTERVKISKIAGEKQKLKISINEKPVRKNGDEWLSAEILERTSQFLSSEKKNYNDGRGFLPKTGYENNNVTSKMNEVVKSKEILDLFNTLEENTIFAENYYDNKQENEVEIEQISDSFNMKKETTIKSMKNGEKTSPPVKNSGFVRFCQNKSEKEMLNENKHSDTPKNEDSSQLNDKSREISLKEEPTSENQKGALKEEGVGNKRNYNEMTQDIAICWTSELSKITDNFLNVEKNHYDDMEWSKLEVIFNNKNEVREQIELLQRSQGIKTIETNNEDNQQKFNKIELKPTRKENLNESEERSHLNKKIVAIEIQQIEDYPELKKASSSFVMEEIERYEDSKLMYKELKDYREIENKNEEDLPEYLQEKSKGFISNEMKHFHDVKYTTVKNESATEGQNNEGDTEFKHESNHGASDTYSDEINMKQKYLKEETSERNEVSNRNIENDNTGIPKELNEEETIVRSLENQQMKNELIEKKEDSLKKSEKSVFPSFSSDKSKNNILCDNQHESSKKSEYPESNQIIANFLEQEEGKYDDGIYIASTFKTKKLKKDEFIITPIENIETNEESDRIKNKLLTKTLVLPFFAEESKQDITSIDGQKDLISKETDSKDNFSKLKQITTNFLSVEKNKYDDGITITNIIHIPEKNGILLENRKNKDELEYNKKKSLEKTIPTNLFKEKSIKNIPRDNKPSLVKKNKDLKGNCSETKLIKTSLNSPEKENENGLYHARKIQIQEPKEEKVIHTILANQKMKEESDEIKGSSEKILLTHFLEGKLKPDIPNDIHQEDENSKSKETTANFLLQEREKYEDSSKFRIQKPKEEVTEEPLENPEIKGEFNKIKKESSKKSLFTTFFTEKSKIDITSADEPNSIQKETYSTYSKMKEITTNFLLEEKYKYDDGINLTGKIQIREKNEKQVIEIPLQNQKNKDILKKIEEESSKKTVFISPFKEKSKKDILRDSAPDFVSRDKDMMKEDYSKSREITRNFLLWEKEKYQDSIDHASKIKIEEPRKEKVIIDSPPGNKKLKEASDKTGKQSSTKTFFGSLFTGKTIKTAGEQKETNSKENYSKLIEITSHFLAEEKTKCEDEITLASKVQIRKKNGKNVIEIPLGNQNELEESNNITEESTTKTFSTSLVTEKVNKQKPIDKEPILTQKNKSVKDNSELKEKITNFLPRKKGKDEDGISRLSNIQIPASNDESFIKIPSENQNIISGEAITGLLPSDKTSYITNEFLNMELRNYNDNLKYHEFDMECERKRKINREKICSIDMPQNEEKTIEIDSDKEKKHNAFPKQTENKAALKIDGDHKKIVINEDIIQESILFPKKHEKRGVFRLFKERSKEEKKTKHSEVTQMTPGDKKLDLNSNDNINQNEDEINLSSEEIIDKTKELRASEMNKYHDVKYSRLFNITEEQKDEQINSVEINRECSNTDHSILSDNTTKTSVSYKASKESEEHMKSEKTGNISFFKRKSISDTQSESKREEDGEFTEPDQVRDKKIVFSGRQELNKGMKNDDNMHNESEIIWSPILLQKLCNDFLNSELELYQDAVYSKSIEPETENMKTINENILEHRRAITLFRDSTTSDRGFNLGSSNLEQLNQLNDFRQDETRKENFSIGSRKVSEGNESTEMRIDTFIVPDLFKDNLKTKTEDDCVTMDNIAQCDEGEDLLALKIASSAFLFNEKEVYEDCRQVIERSEYCPAHLAILPFEEEKQIDMITRDDTLQNERININCSPTQMNEFLKNEIQFYDCIKFNNSMTKSKDKELIIEEVCDNTDESEKTGLKETPKQSKKHAKNAFINIFTQNPKTTTMNDSHNLSEKNEQFKMTKEQYKKINIEDERENEDIYKVSHEQTDSGPYLLTSEFLSSEKENYQDSKYSKNKNEENRNIFEPFVSEGRYNTESESKVKNEIIHESSSEIANAKQEISSDISTEIRMPSKKEEKSAILNYFKNRLKKRYMGQSETEKNSKQEEYEKTQLKNESSAFLFKEKEIYEDSLYEVGNNSIENESKIRINGISIQSSPSDPWEQRKEQTRWEECSAIEQNKQISSAFAEQNENLSNVDSMVISHELAQITRTFLDRERNIDGDIINVSIRGVPDEDLKTQKKDKKNTFELLRGALISKFKDDCYTPNYIQETTDFFISEQQLYDTGKDIETSRKHFVTENENQRERTKTEKRGIQVPNIPQVEISSKQQLDGSQSKVADKITTENRQNENTAMKMNKRRGIFGFLKKKFKETENSFHTDTKPQLQLKRKGSTSQEKIDKLTPLEMAKLTPHIDKPHDLTEETEMPKKSAINESSVKSKLELNKNAKHEVETTESRKRILGFLFKNKKYKNKEKTSTYHKAEEFLKILEDTKTFLDKETEMYHDIRSNLTSENLNILILNIPTESESQDSEENIGNILKDTSTFIQNEINNYYDDKIQTYSEKPEDEYYVNIPEYTAFDFIKEEIETFEATKLPNTSKVDSSIRIETEVETIDGDSPKEIITKKIVISEKLMEMKDVLKNNTSEEIFKKLMVVNEDLKAQLNINKLASSESEKPENSTMHETTNMSISESNEDQIRGFLSENMNQASNRNKNIHETMTREMKKLEKVQEHMENECLPKFKDDKSAESTIVEDVSLFEGETNILKNKEQEVVTDLDDITSDEISSVDSQHGEEMDRMLMDKYQEYSDEQLPIIEDNIAEQRIEKNTQFTQIRAKEKLRSQTSEYQNFESSNERSPKKKIIVTKLSERGSIFSEVMQVPEDFITDLKIEYSPYKKQSKGHPDEIQQTHSEENKTITNNTRRKPLFRIESEEEHSVNSTEVDAINPINEELDNLLRDLKMSNSEIRNVDIKPEENVDLTEKANQSAQDDIETIEKKLRDLGNALDTLEQLDETELSEQYKVREKKLRRVERKFERMASETDELATVSKQTVELTNPAENEQYQQLVSQLSQDEVMSFQGDYNNLWDEYTFSKSNELDSKTPESQADVFELPQGETSQSSGPSDTTISKGQPEFSSEKEGGEHRQQPIDQHQLSSEMKELLKEMEEASKK